MTEGASRLAAIWLWAVAALVVALVLVGGATRLTGSGLSITQWRPILGALPPTSPTAWAKAFSLYRETTQYQLVNRGIGLDAFKGLFWWEWAHRLLARAVGAAFAVPFIALLASRRLPSRLIWPCVGLLALGALQGAAGWWMVRTGLEGRIAVAPEALATHLGLALLLFGALIWTGLEAWAGRGPRHGGRRKGWAISAGAFLALVYLQCLLGALVAGNRAGLIDNDWPLMAGRFFPSDYWRGSAWASLVHGSAAVQFNHRLLAYGAVVFVVTAVVIAFRSDAARAIKRLWVAASLVTLAQAVLGVMTLLSGVSLSLAMLHQVNATVLLAISVSLAWRTWRRIPVL